MPAPDPEGIDYGYDYPDRISFLVHQGLFGTGNKRHPMHRAKSILMKISADGWRCRWCWEPVPLARRADAQYCCEACRKRAAKSRRMIRA